MPNEIYSSGVQLWDKNGASATLNNGSGLLLHPETELKYVKPDVGGGITSSGNSLGFSPEEAMSSGLEDAISSKFCPLEAIVAGDTQYADMYTDNASAVITELPGSTGYGTLVNVIQTIDHVRSTDSATNAYIPTEHAVAVALSEKQDELIQGACLTISQNAADPTKADISVNTVYTIEEYLAYCSTNDVPTEYAVREAIENASAAIDSDITELNNSITYVSSSVDSLTDVVNNINNWDSATTGSYGVVILQNTIDTNTGASLPTASAIKDYVDSHAGKPISSGSGIDVTDEYGSYTISLNSAGEDSIGGVNVPDSHGLVLNNGALTLDIADDDHIGGVLIPNNGPISINQATGAVDIALASDTQSGIVYVPTGSGLSANSGRLTAVTASSYDDYAAADAGVVGAVKVVKTIANTTTAEYLNSGYVPSVQAVYDYVATHGGRAVSQGTGITVGSDTTSYTITLNEAQTGIIGGVCVPANKGIALVTGAISLAEAPIVADYTTASSYISAGNIGGVVVMSSIVQAGTGQSSYVAVPTVDAVYNYVEEHGGGGGTAAYTGPFAVYPTATGATTYHVSGGYLKWLDGNEWIPGSNGGWSLATNGDKLYFVGSSGILAGEAISNPTYQVTVGGTVFTRTGNSAGSGYSWINGATTIWCPDYIPGVDSATYTDSNCTTANGAITAVVNRITVGGNVYNRAAVEEGSQVKWTSGTASQYTGSPWPAAGDSTYQAAAISSGYTTTSAANAIPPAGKFYTILAENIGGVVKQQQYGTIWHEHWGDDYKGQFAISRITIDQAAADAPTAANWPYKYVVAIGGRIYGGVDFSTGFIGGIKIDGGIILMPGDIEYPEKTINGVIKHDGLYFHYNETNEVWLNIYKDNSSNWHFLVDSECKEPESPTDYSVQLGWITINGAPQQEHMGAIAIRGRWT